MKPTEMFQALRDGWEIYRIAQWTNGEFLISIRNGSESYVVRINPDKLNELELIQLMIGIIPHFQLKC